MRTAKKISSNFIGLHVTCIMFLIVTTETITVALLPVMCIE